MAGDGEQQGVQSGDWVGRVGGVVGRVRDGLRRGTEVVD